jgi:ribonucleotide reductase beta subunit family protein with ferritin-like domain
MSIEPLLHNDFKYRVFTGIVYQDLEELCETQEKAKWIHTEIKLHEDIKHFASMSASEQEYIKHVLSFSVVSDTLINSNLSNRFLQEIQDPSCTRFLTFQSFMEDQHNRTYSDMITALVPDREELYRLMQPHENSPTISKKIQWIEKWINSDSSFGQRVLAFIIVEGIFFSSLFCAFYWLRHMGSKLPGLIQANEFIARDESLHWLFSVRMLHHVNDKPSRETIIEMFKEAVEIEHEFVDGSLSNDLFNMNANQMKQYVMFVADYVINKVPYNEGTSIKYINELYGIANPFEWMVNMSIPVLTNYFERTPTNYQSIQNKGHIKASEISLEDEF